MNKFVWHRIDISYKVIQYIKITKISNQIQKMIHEKNNDQIKLNTLYLNLKC